MRAKADPGALATLQQFLDAPLVANFEVGRATRGQRVARLLTGSQGSVHVLKASIQCIILWLLVQRVDLAADMRQIRGAMHAIVVELYHWRLVA